MVRRKTEETGSNKDDWETPQFILDWVKKEYGDYFDPCPLYGLENGFDGLNKDWDKVNFINPPYSAGSDKEAFIRKAKEEGDKGNICVVLIPASTETAIFHDVIKPNAQIFFIRKRVPFKGFNQKGEYVTNKCGLSGSMLCIFGVNRLARGTMDTIEFT